LLGRPVVQPERVQRERLGRAPRRGGERLARLGSEHALGRPVEQPGRVQRERLGHGHRRRIGERDLARNLERTPPLRFGKRARLDVEEGSE